MSFIRTTNRDTNKREELNSFHIRKVIDNGQGQPADIVFSDGSTLEVKESAQSVRGYIKKANSGESED